MNKPNLKKLRKNALMSFVMTFIVFLIVLIFALMGFDKVVHYMFYLVALVWLNMMFHGIKFVYYGNKQGINNLKNNQPFFSKSLLEGDDRTDNKSKKEQA